MERQTLGEVVEKVTKQDRNKKDVFEPVGEACKLIASLTQEMFDCFIENVEAFEQLKPQLSRIHSNAQRNLKERTHFCNEELLHTLQKLPVNQCTC